MGMERCQLRMPRLFARCGAGDCSLGWGRLLACTVVAVLLVAVSDVRPFAHNWVGQHPVAFQDPHCGAGAAEGVGRRRAQEGACFSGFGVGEWLTGLLVLSFVGASGQLNQCRKRCWPLVARRPGKTDSTVAPQNCEARAPAVGEAVVPLVAASEADARIKVCDLLVKLGEAAGYPRSIYHALHRSFDELRHMLPELAASGFDAVQLTPAQVSPPGDLRTQWYLRYQPLRYGAIDSALGGESALRALCAEAQRLGVHVVADCVFNHGAVVASKTEWKAAQKNPKLLEELKQRLDDTFAPELTRKDFQFPWICLEGSKWDDPAYTYEGWGCGEWSELRFSEHVLAVHFGHLRRLLTCGVRGFRLDAAKHMRPEHVKKYVDFLHKEGAFVYAEVLSLSRAVHAQYETLGSGAKGSVRSTDYMLAKSLRDACRLPPSASGSLSPSSSARSATSSSPSAPRAAHLMRLLRDPGCLGAAAVRFARSHDTALNDGHAICGIDWSSAEDAKMAWAVLLTAPEGSVLVYEADAMVPVVRRALAFRRAVECRVAGGPVAVEMDAAACFPNFDMVAVILRATATGEAIGLALLNFGETGSEAREHWQVPWELPGVNFAEVVDGAAQQGERSWAPQLGSHVSFESGVTSPVLVRPLDGRFFLAQPLAASAALEVRRRAGQVPRGLLMSSAYIGQMLVLRYLSSWRAPHLHFGVGGVWTTSPGWPLHPAVALPHCREARGDIWWVVQVPVARGSGPVEFVLNDGGNSWDQPPGGGNYKTEHSGIFVLEKGKLKCLES
mmetsp:Transcript_173765/g.556933  ORF Transcript_173765/g.556933 Transcript_173765/m.556933 type:complete len:785 (+) Transcript_173765:103-2457(+)